MHINREITLIYANENFPIDVSIQRYIYKTYLKIK